MEEWLSEIDPKELGGIMGQIAELIGLEATLKLAQTFGGANLYIPKPDLLLASMRDRRIRDEYRQGKTVRELALRYNLSESWVREVLAKSGIQTGQMSLL